MINKYYVTDLAPDRSMIEYLVKGGQQVFAISWRNPDERHADWNLDTYVQADPRGAGRRRDDQRERPIARSRPVRRRHHAALAVAAPRAERRGRPARRASTLGVCVLDNEQAGHGGRADRPRRRPAGGGGVGTQAAISTAARWPACSPGCAPNDLIWNYWVNNYLLGKEPPAFDVLFWNADATNMPAGLHRDFVELSLENSLVEPGGVEVLGTPSTSRASRPTRTSSPASPTTSRPGRTATRTTQLLGSEPRFVLSTSGHIAALVNPPGNEKASYQTGNEQPAGRPDEWLESAAKQRGTWWEDWIEWLGERSGDEKQARKKLGGRGYKPPARRRPASTS